MLRTPKLIAIWWTMSIGSGSESSDVHSGYIQGSAAFKIWRGMECYARGTTLVHGSRALKYLDGCGESTNASDVLAKMVDAGVLIPEKLDIAGADMSTRAFLSLQYGDTRLKSIRGQKWSPGFACLWTYKPGNPTPMKEWYD